MSYQLILKNIAKHISLNPKEQAHFTNFLEIRKTKRKEFVLRASAPCPYLYFVNAGILRAFHVNEEGKDSTVMFAIPDWWITDMYCFLNQKPAMVTIQVVEAGELLSLSKANLDTLYEDIPKFEKFFRLLMQNAYCREQLRIIQNLSLSAKERYYHFLAKYPQISQQVTQKHIASYLGITPEFLSAIRAQKEK